MRKTTLVFAALAVLVLVARPALAQTPVQNPTIAQFPASADDSAVQFGTALVTSYSVNVYKADGVTLVKSTDVGKPTPDAANLDTVPLAGALATLTAGTYVAKVAANGPSGPSENPLGAPFTLAPRRAAAPGPLVIR